MLETLEHEGYVVRRTEPASYAPTGRALLLSAGYDEPTWIGGIAEPILNKFRKQIHWPSDIAVLDPGSMVIAHTTRVDGRRCSAVRRVFAFPSSAPRWDAPVSPSASPPSRSACPRLPSSVRSPGNDLARNPDKLTKALRTIRKAGFAVMGEATAAVSSAAQSGRLAFPSRFRTGCSAA